MHFRPPVRDLLHALDVAGIGRLQSQAAFADLDGETLYAILTAAGDFLAERFAPINRAGDVAGARYENGRVTPPAGFAEAYRAFADGGWNSLSASPDHGGQGLPKALELAVFEMAHAANMALTLCPMLTQGAIDALSTHGSARQRGVYLPRLVSGAWTGTMNLTEPQAGSDLAAVAARAEPDGKGGYRLFGQKIFITWGDHDMADNIVHLVLARLPDAPPGVRGISLFLAPKRLVDETGALAGPNALRPGSIEHKLGIRGSPTCVMLYEGAEAELVGVENHGLAHMFTMMNAARVQVGAQGVGVAERATQRALAYALERRQGRSVWTGENPARLFDLPDVRRMLMAMKAKTAAARAICLMTGVAADLARHAGTAAERAGALARQELLTPIAKAWSTEMGVEVASLGVQVHGGMGFIEETGAAQHYRDARIAPIYEGTNGIQAIDLAGRKIGGDPAAVGALLGELEASAKAMSGPLGGVGARLAEAVEALRAATGWMRSHPGADSLAGASAYLGLFGDVLGGWALAKGALAVDGQDSWARSKLALARFYADQALSGAKGKAAAVMAGAGALDVSEAGLT